MDVHAISRIVDEDQVFWCGTNKTREFCSSGPKVIFQLADIKVHGLFIQVLNPFSTNVAHTLGRGAKRTVIQIGCVGSDIPFPP